MNINHPNTHNESDFRNNIRVKEGLASSLKMPRVNTKSIRLDSGKREEARRRERNNNGRCNTDINCLVLKPNQSDIANAYNEGMLEDDDVVKHGKVHRQLETELMGGWSWRFRGDVMATLEQHDFLEQTPEAQENAMIDAIDDRYTNPERDDLEASAEEVSENGETWSSFGVDHGYDGSYFEELNDDFEDDESEEDKKYQEQLVSQEIEDQEISAEKMKRRKMRSMGRADRAMTRKKYRERKWVHDIKLEKFQREMENIADERKILLALFPNKVSTATSHQPSEQKKAA